MEYTSKDFVDKRCQLLIFGTAYILTVALSLPIASLLTLAGGALFGWIGAAVIISAATIGATIVFIFARMIQNEFFVKHHEHGRMEAGFKKNAFSYLLALRLIASPFLGCKYHPALLGMRLRHYVLATSISITPGTLIYVWVAKSFDILMSADRARFVCIKQTGSDCAFIRSWFALSFPSLVETVTSASAASASDVTNVDSKMK